MRPGNTGALEGMDRRGCCGAAYLWAGEHSAGGGLALVEVANIIIGFELVLSGRLRANVVVSERGTLSD